MARVVRQDDPALATLLSSGWTVVARSWGAHIDRIDDALIALLREYVDRAERQGVVVAALQPDHDPAIVALDDRIHDDYPRSPATPHRALDRAAVGALRERGTRFVGAVEDGDVVAVTALRLEGTRAETEFTAVDREHRRRGFAVAVKARAMLDAIEDGATRFGTGGSALNAGSLRMNSACGYVVDEHWVSLEPPAR